MGHSVPLAVRSRADTGALEGIEDVYASEDKEGGDSVSYVVLKVLRLRWY